MIDKNDPDLLYAALKSRRDATPTVRELPEDERKRYNADTVRAYRARQKEAQERGAPEPSAVNIRHALADAAIAILATNSEGADQIRNVLASIFSSKPGVPMNVENQIQSRKLKPKLLKVPK